MRRALLSILLCLLYCGHSLQAQVELVAPGQLEYAEGVLNDVWGYAADGKEYALVGLTIGVSIVDVTEADNPVELHFIPGMSSTWRDIKTWEDHAYVTTEASDGLLIIDLSMLPESINHHNHFYGDELVSAHNFFIDEFGVGYTCAPRVGITSGIPQDERGVIFLDIAANKWEPPIIGTYYERYFHDIYTRDNIMYTSDINDGTLSIWDVNDKENIILLGRTETPNLFTHNAWLSDDSQYIFTTDERAGAYVASYDISDFGDIRELHRYQSSVGGNVTPHNAHVLNDWVVVSYYTDGVRVLDANRPDILVETAYFDTDPEDQGGCWGAYPFLPSGNILATDFFKGLSVIAPQYDRAGYLTGNIVSDLGNPLQNVHVTIVGHGNDVKSTSIGTYKTGMPITNNATQTFDVQFEAYGYEVLLVEGVEITATEETVLDVQMQRRLPVAVSVNVADNSGSLIQKA